MAMRIKDWGKFQHFKDRTPPWIKLYREVLDDPDWHALDGESAKILVMLWLIASEDKTMSGELPDLRRLAFRLRTDEKTLQRSVIKLSHWVELDDINVISDCNHLDAPERAGEETETETETERARTKQKKDDSFDQFWSAYPKKVGKAAAEKSWSKAKPDLAVVLAAIRTQSDSDQWLKDGGQFIPNPATWINQRRWEDEAQASLLAAPKKIYHVDLTKEPLPDGWLPPPPGCTKYFDGIGWCL